MHAATRIDQSEICRGALSVLGSRTLVFVGLMGAGKSVIGRLTAQQLALPFVDSDSEIERVSRMSVAELFEAYGEPEFRALESRVIARLLTAGPRVLSTGGGAFINGDTRALIKRDALSVWLKADLETLWERVNKRDHRPLLKTPEPKKTLSDLMTKRYPIYEEADIVINSRPVGKDVIVRETLAAIAALAPAEPTLQAKAEG